MGKSKSRIFWRNGIAYAWGYDGNGKRWQESTHQRDQIAAERVLQTLDRKYAADPAARTRSKVTLRVALQHVLDFQGAAGRSPATARATKYHAEHLAGWLGPDTPLAAVTLADTTRYLRERLGEDASRHTIAKELRTLTQAIRRVTKLGLYVPVVGPEHLVPDELGKAYEPRDRWLTREEYAALLAVLTPKVPGRLQRVAPEKRVRAARQDRRDYVIAWCNLGLRKSELFDVQPQDYDHARRELRVRGTKTEGADRLVPVNDAAAEVLTRRVMCQQSVPFPKWSDGSCTRDLARACAKAMIRNVTPNDFRRTFCSWLCQAGVAERYCAELLGHEETNMVRAVYGQLDRASLQRAVALI